jgi:ribosomal protein S18 acetylase RimI-like enzyme
MELPITQRTAVPPCLLLEWDSAFFGFRVAQVAGEILSESTGQALLEWCEAHSLRCLYFLADPNSAQTADVAHRLNFNMVDVRVQLSLKRGLLDSTTVAGFDLRTARSSDLAALQAIARGAHRDSRFFFDRHFPKARAEELFATWIAADCAGRADRVFILDRKGIGAVAYITCNLTTGLNAGRIGLVGVASEFRGVGLGTALVSGALNWFWSVDARTVFVVTQGRNVAAQRLYQGAGFRTEDVKIWYHRWF